MSAEIIWFKMSSFFNINGKKLLNILRFLYFIWWWTREQEQQEQNNTPELEKQFGSGPHLKHSLDILPYYLITVTMPGVCNYAIVAFLRSLIIWDGMFREICACLSFSSVFLSPNVLYHNISVVGVVAPRLLLMLTKTDLAQPSSVLQITTPIAPTRITPPPRGMRWS